jgi:hypothetical protein
VLANQEGAIGSLFELLKNPATDPFICIQVIMMLTHITELEKGKEVIANQKELIPSLFEILANPTTSPTVHKYVRMALDIISNFPSGLLIIRDYLRTAIELNPHNEILLEFQSTLKSGGGAREKNSRITRRKKNSRRTRREKYSRRTRRK